MSNQSRASVRQAWVDRVDRFQQSNQTASEFCHAEGISQASLCQWRRKLSLANAAVTQPLPAFVPVKLRASEVSTTPTAVMSVELPKAVDGHSHVSIDNVELAMWIAGVPLKAAKTRRKRMKAA